MHGALRQVQPQVQCFISTTACRTNSTFSSRATLIPFTIILLVWDTQLYTQRSGLHEVNGIDVGGRVKRWCPSMARDSSVFPKAERVSHLTASDLCLCLLLFFHPFCLPLSSLILCRKASLSTENVN